MSYPTIPPEFLIADPSSTGDAQGDASRFLVENSHFLTESSVDKVYTKYQLIMGIYRSIPSWMMMPLFVICFVIFIVVAVPLFIVFVRLTKNPKELVRIASLFAFGCIVGVISLFI